MEIILFVIERGLCPDRIEKKLNWCPSFYKFVEYDGHPSHWILVDRINILNIQALGPE